MKSPLLVVPKDQGGTLPPLREGGQNRRIHEKGGWGKLGFQCCIFQYVDDNKLSFKVAIIRDMLS